MIGKRDRFTLGERAAALVEYALLVALIALLCMVAVETIGREASSTLVEVGNSISAAP